MRKALGDRVVEEPGAVEQELRIRQPAGCSADLAHVDDGDDHEVG